jgi:hypothetical protein
MIASVGKEVEVLVPLNFCRESSSPAVIGGETKFNQ